MRRANSLQIQFGKIADELGCREEMMDARMDMYQENNSNRLSVGEAISSVKELYGEQGDVVFSWNWLNDHGHSNVVRRCRGSKMSPDDLARACGVDPSPLAARRKANTLLKSGRIDWTKSMVWQAIDEVIREHNGSMPSWDWLRLNGSAPMLYAMQRFGISTAVVKRERPGAYHHNRLTCRQGLRWDSYPETMLSNFFYGRGFDVQNGSAYPSEYSAFSGRSSGRYDMHITASEPPHKGERLLCGTPYHCHERCQDAGQLCAVFVLVCHPLCLLQYNSLRSWSERGDSDQAPAALQADAHDFSRTLLTMSR